MDVLIIGGGIIGCAIAWELAGRGVRVRLLERRSVGTGASRASAGMLCPHIEGSPTPLTPLTTTSVERYDAFIQAVQADSGHHIEYRRTGTLEVALGAHESARLAAIADSLRRAGVPHQLLSGAQARELEPALCESVTAGLLVPGHGYLSAPALTAGLAEAARRRGATTRDMTEVGSVEGGPGGVRVTTAHDEWRAGAVVLAAGTWAGQVAVASAPAAPVRPIRGQLLYVHTGVPAVSRVIWSSGCYLVPWTDGTLLVGATVEDVGFAEEATVEGVSGLLRSACEVVPVVTSARYRDVRVGLRPGTADGLPIIGRSSHVPGLIYATGHGRNGVMLAPLTALMVADLVTEGRAHEYLQVTNPGRMGL